MVRFWCTKSQIMSKSQEICGTWKQRVIGKMIGWILRVVGWTLRYKISGLKQITGKYSVKPVIYSLWHNRIFAMPHINPQLGAERDIVVLTSASEDGAILENAVKVFGIEAVRGSSSRRGATALIALRKKLTVGVHVCITPDGPRGPMQVLQAGVIKLAQFSGSPIIAINVEFSSCWRMKTWDKFCIPKPFSKVYVKLEEGVEVPKVLDQEEFEKYRVDVESLMNKEYNQS